MKILSTSSIAATALLALAPSSFAQQASGGQQSELAQKLAEAERELSQLRAKLATAERDDAKAVRWDNVKSLYEQALATAPALPDSPRLGITLDTDSDKGALLRAVLRDGPADRAGLRGGDLLTHVDGRALRQSGKRPSDELIRLIREADTKTPLKLRYERRGKSLETTATPERLDRRPTSGLFPQTFFDRSSAPRVSSVPRFSRSGLWGRWSDMQLVPMSEGLESYFGTKEGLLVLDPPSDNELLQLKAGDVVLAIGDREPSNATHLLRILRSYESGETVRVQVMRQKRRETLTFELPEEVGSLLHSFPRPVSLERSRVAPVAPAAPVKIRVPRSDAPNDFN